MKPIVYPKSQVLMICDRTKDTTARKPTINANLGSCKFLNNFRYGHFAEANISEIERDVHISSFDDRLAQRLGYGTVEEYLSNNWNDEYDTRTLIRWDAIDVRWDVVKQLGVI